MSDRLPFRFVNEGGVAISPVVELDGRDIAASVSRVEFAAGVGDVPLVVLTIVPIKGATVDLAGAIVTLSPENCELLTTLGWTPPEDAAAKKAAAEALLANAMTPNEAIAHIEAHPLS